MHDWTVNGSQSCNSYFHVCFAFILFMHLLVFLRVKNRAAELLFFACLYSPWDCNIFWAVSWSSYWGPQPSLLVKSWCDTDNFKTCYDFALKSLWIEWLRTTEAAKPTELWPKGKRCMMDRIEFSFKTRIHWTLSRKGSTVIVSSQSLLEIV